MNISAKTLRITYAVLLALLLLAPFIGLYPVFIMKLLCFCIFACAFNLLLGFTGLLSFGHAAFFGFSAYVTGWFIKAQGFTPELGILAGVIVAPISVKMPLSVEEPLSVWYIAGSVGAETTLVVDQLKLWLGVK